MIKIMAFLSYSLTTFLILATSLASFLNLQPAFAQNFTQTSNSELPLNQSYSNKEASQANPSIKPSPNIKLVGTIIGAKSQTLALIQAPDKSMRFYHIDDNIFGYKLIKIEPDHIRLLRHSKLFIVYLQEKVASNKSDSHPQSPHQPEQTSIHIPTTLLTHIQQNTQQWLNAVNLSLKVSEGRARGYIVNSIQNIPYQANIGLKQDDVIRAINGIPVGQPKIFAQLVNRLDKFTDITILVERNDRLHQINLSTSE